MRRLLVPLALSLSGPLAACNGGDDKDDDTDTGTVDTADSGDTSDSADTGDTADSGDTGDTGDTDAGDTDTDTDTDVPRTTTAGGLTWDVRVAAASPVAVTAAYTAVGDVDGDGQLDVVFTRESNLPNIIAGRVFLLTWDGDLSTWNPPTVIANASPPGVPVLYDVDGDSDVDIVNGGGNVLCESIPGFLGGGPCGAVRWFEQDGSSWNTRVILSNDDHNPVELALADLDDDGLQDLVVSAERLATVTGGAVDSGETYWLRGTASSPYFEAEKRPIGDSAGAHPQLVDLDGDDDLDILLAQRGVGMDGFVWFEQVVAPVADATVPVEDTDDTDTDVPAPLPDPGTWLRHVIRTDQGPGYMLRAFDGLEGGGVTIVGTNHTNTSATPPDAEDSVVLRFTVPLDPTASPWANAVISDTITSRAPLATEPIAAPGEIAAGDVDDDGDQDLIVSGFGDDRVLWLRQGPAGTWTQLDLLADAGRARGLQIVDLDGDDDHEIVLTLFEDSEVLVLERQ